MKGSRGREEMKLEEEERKKEERRAWRGEIEWRERHHIHEKEYVKSLKKSGICSEKQMKV